MRLGDIFDPSVGTAYAKSGFGGTDARWPAVSMSLQGDADALARAIDVKTDIVLTIGTKGPETANPAHRGAIISVARVIKQRIDTRRVIPEESWKLSATRHADRWAHSLPATALWILDHPADAGLVCPLTYAALGNRHGRPVAVDKGEISRLLDLGLRQELFTPRTDVAAIIVRSEPAVMREMHRMAMAILDRVGRSGQSLSRTAPRRSVPFDGSQLEMALDAIWNAQGGFCALCSGPMPLRPENPLLQVSPDRIDSGNPSYGPDNVQLTHLACNLAKSDATRSQFLEWLALRDHPR